MIEFLFYIIIFGIVVAAMIALVMQDWPPGGDA